MLGVQAAGENIPGSTGNVSIANESQFVEATSALAQGLFDFDLVMGRSSLHIHRIMQMLGGRPSI